MGHTPCNSCCSEIYPFPQLYHLSADPWHVLCIHSAGIIPGSPRMTSIDLPYQPRHLPWRASWPLSHHGQRALTSPLPSLLQPYSKPLLALFLLPGAALNHKGITYLHHQVLTAYRWCAAEKVSRKQKECVKLHA